MRRDGSRNQHLLQRIPADVRARAVGLKLDVPIGETTVPITISPRAVVVKISLRTADPREVKVRQAAAAAFLETVWQAVRTDTQIPLTYKQATALAGQLYRAWAAGEGREHNSSAVLDMQTRKPMHDDGNGVVDSPELWDSAARHLEALARVTKGRRRQRTRCGDP